MVLLVLRAVLYCLQWSEKAGLAAGAVPAGPKPTVGRAEATEGETSPVAKRSRLFDKHVCWLGNEGIDDVQDEII